MSGSNFTFKRNGTQVGTATDATYSAGTRHGIWSGNLAGASRSFDEYSHTS
jgi:hypothetical protein